MEKGKEERERGEGENKGRREKEREEWGREGEDRFTFHLNYYCLPQAISKPKFSSYMVEDLNTVEPLV